MSGRYPYAKKAAEKLRENRIWLARAEGLTVEQTGFDPPETDHNPPSQGHYRATYKWDEAAADYMSATAAIEHAIDGDLDMARYCLNAAKRGLRVDTAGIDETGFQPNYRYLGKPRRFDLEMMLAFKRGATHSNYTQPPLNALSVRKTFEAAKLLDEEPDLFLDEMYAPLARHYDYFNRELKGSNGLIRIPHPHTTGRDSDPTFDDIKFRIPRDGVSTPKIVDKINIALDYGSILWHGIRLRRAHDDIQEMLKIYSMNDIMMNCIYADNLREMAQLAREQLLIFDASRYEKLANKLEQKILEEMWFPDARGGRGVFYGLGANGEPIKEISISNLFPLTIRTLKEEQLASILDLMQQSFNVPYPLPSVATDSKNYDPHNHESWRLWRGPKWMITDWYIVERGLWRQAERTDIDQKLVFRCQDWARRIARQSKIVVDREGAREHYNPITGKGQRKAVVNFGWSYLAYLMRDSD